MFSTLSHIFLKVSGVTALATFLFTGFTKFLTFVMQQFPDLGAVGDVLAYMGFFNAFVAYLSMFISAKTFVYIARYF